MKYKVMPPWTTDELYDSIVYLRDSGIKHKNKGSAVIYQCSSGITLARIIIPIHLWLLASNFDNIPVGIKQSITEELEKSRIVIGIENFKDDVVLFKWFDENISDD